MIPRQFNYDYDHDQRKRQIDTLKIFNDNVEVIRENEEYAVTFHSAGRKFTITVILGLNFPNEKPRIIIDPVIKHNWCNTTTGEIECAPGLLNFTRHSDLGRVVHAIIREYEKFPPSILSDNTTTNHSTIENNVSVRNISNIPELSNLSLEDLKKLDSDPEFLNDFVEEISVIRSLNEELDLVIDQVESTSKENQSKETYLNELKTKVSNDIVTLKSLGTKCENLNQKYQKKSENLSPQHIRELLQIAVSNADAVCEKIVEQFLNGEMDVQAFINCYIQSKKISAERKAKEERLVNQLNALERATI